MRTNSPSPAPKGGPGSAPAAGAVRRGKPRRTALPTDVLANMVVVPSGPSVHVPDTVSPEAQAFLRTLGNPALLPAFPEPDDLEGWKRLRAFAEADGAARSAPLLQRLAHTVRADRLGGVPILDVRPRGWTDDGKVAVFAHGGAHVMHSASSTLGRAVLFAHATGLRVLSIDYTVAPLATYDRITDEMVRAIGAIVKRGPRLSDTVVYGEESGGGLAAASLLKMRDRGLGMPAAAVLVSPWVDLTPSGDTETTLRGADPHDVHERHGRRAAAAFAPPAMQKHPYASPVYGDYAAGFPPTLIQGGLKERLLSGFVRLYQALDLAGVPVKLDLYEGMVHDFQNRIPDAREAIVARSKMRSFVRERLNMGDG